LVKNGGLVVLTSCSHRGVINTIRQAQAASCVSKVHAVIGGFHIVPPLGDDYIGVQGNRPGLPSPCSLLRRAVLRSRARRVAR
jgi:hypothetical protein